MEWVECSLPHAAMKIVEKINASISQGETFFSFEYYPPRTEEVSHPRLAAVDLFLQGVENVYDNMDTMVSYGPTFCDITWGAGGSTSDLTLEIASKMQNMICIETMMHLTCTNMPVAKLKDALVEVTDPLWECSADGRCVTGKGSWDSEYTGIEGRSTQGTRHLCPSRRYVPLDYDRVKRVADSF